MRYKVIIEYNGSLYSGWQRQTGLRTISGAIETAILKATQETVDVFGSGRTDAGVHARGQVAHFDLQKDWDTFRLLSAINAHLIKDDIAILSCVIVPDFFHARFSSKKRHYRYIILNRQAKETLDKNQVWKISQPLQLLAMEKGAKYLKGNHDFSAFRSSQCGALSPIKTLDYIKITKKDDYIIFDIRARSFLHHMVRNLVGSLVEVGLKKQEPIWIKEVLNSGNRTLAGPTAPASGLYFMKVDY